MSPEPNSIQGIIRQHPRSGLYVRPILWTPVQLRLLGCEFVRIKPPAKGLERGNDGADASNGGSEERWSQRERVRVLKRLSTLGSREEARERVLDVLQPYSPHCFFDDRDSLPFIIDGQAVAEVKVDSVCFTDPENGLQGSLVAYLDLTTLDGLRKKKFRGWDSTTNEPRARLRRKKLRLHTPADAAEDPYMVAVLIAVAQMRRLARKGRQQPATPPPPPLPCGDGPRGSDGALVAAETAPTATGFKVHLLVYSSQPPAETFLYQATISCAFLDKFERSSCASPCDPIRIPYDRFPLRRPQRLVEQLPRVLGWAPDGPKVPKMGGGSLVAEDEGGVGGGENVQDEVPGEEDWEWD